MSTCNILKIDLLYTVITLVKCCHTLRKLIFSSTSMSYLACKPISSWSKVLYSYLWPLQRKNKHDLCLNERVTVQMENMFLKLLQCSKQYISSLDELFWFLKHLSFTNYIILRLLWKKIAKFVIVSFGHP